MTDPLLLDLLLLEVGPPLDEPVLLLLLAVELLKVAGDDGDGQGHHQHTADGAEAPHKLVG